jgi:hypothetical protein
MRQVSVKKRRPRRVRLTRNEELAARLAAGGGVRAAPLGPRRPLGGHHLHARSLH